MCLALFSRMWWKWSCAILIPCFKYPCYIYAPSLRILASKRWTNWVKPAAAAVKSLQSCLTLCDPIGGSPPGSPIPGILQARTLEWVAISFSNAWKWKVKIKSLSHVRLLATPWTAANQALPSMGFSRQEYWSGMPLPSPSSFSYRQKKCNFILVAKLDRQAWCWTK